MSYEFNHRTMNLGAKPERITDGSRVRHYGTKQWGKVIESIPQADGTFEYHVQRETQRIGERLGTWWASYAIDRVEEEHEVTKGS